MTSPGIGDDAVQPADCAGERVGAAGVDDEPPAALGERLREREPEPARGSGDDSDWHAATVGTGAVGATSGNWS